MNQLPSKSANKPTSTNKCKNYYLYNKVCANKYSNRILIPTVSTRKCCSSREATPCMRSSCVIEIFIREHECILRVRKRGRLMRGLNSRCERGRRLGEERGGKSFLGKYSNTKKTSTFSIRSVNTNLKN